MSWRTELIKWYRLSEAVLGDLVPSLTDEKIVSFISDNKWLVIPTRYEIDKEDSINRPDPNIFINLSQRGKIGLGIVCNTLTSIERMKNILHPFHSLDKDELVKKLNELDDEFMTTLERKIRHDYYAQTPVYEVDLEIRSNQIDSSSISSIFERVGEILVEGRREMRQRGIHWLPVSPHINLTIAWMEANEDVFKEKLEELKPIYEIALRIKTDKEVRDQETRYREEQTAKKQRKFAEFVQELRQRNITGEEYRRLVSEWQNEHP